MVSRRKVLLVFCAATGAFSLLCVWSYFIRMEKFYWEAKTTEYAAYDHAEAAALKSHETNSFDDNLIVIYNRVPKTGSTSFINLAYDLCKKNHFYVLHINITANMHVLSLNNQLSFARNISAWSEMKPALYHGHMAYLDFSK
ncbi:heparin sulfate O-sulfotransferase-like [Sitodiplosis mosellana]|uniref:heparin sulfate O-sulfotransferase-like n=1 Tax=Sitodiplosis mosellana TaxID=263140 RepID=UPI002444CAA2|nr:heparin sulfate O-sulfotransferase-like [Sitodiplosis mosellana]